MSLVWRHMFDRQMTVRCQTVHVVFFQTPLKNETRLRASKNVALNKKQGLIYGDLEIESTWDVQELDYIAGLK